MLQAGVMEDDRQQLLEGGGGNIPLMTTQEGCKERERLSFLMKGAVRKTKLSSPISPQKQRKKLLGKSN